MQFEKGNQNLLTMACNLSCRSTSQLQALCKTKHNLYIQYVHVTCVPALVVYMKIYVYGTLAYVNVGRNDIQTVHIKSMNIHQCSISELLQ